MDLQDKTAIITGASSGIGAATAAVFARAGAKLVIGARHRERLETVASEIAAAGGSVVAVPGDVREERYAEALVDAALSTFGRLDIAFNNAGILGAVGNLSSMTAEQWQDTMAVNLTGAFYGAKHQLTPMLAQGSGSIIFTSSFVGHTIGFPGMAAYGASKAGLIGMTQCLAAEHGPQGVRVNALLPGGTKTGMAGDFSGDPSASDTIAQLHALKRMAEPREIAKVALFLASDAASFVTGAALLADGGNSIHKS